MPETQPTNNEADDFSALSLTPENFQQFYNKIIGLRFPLDVAQVLELRYLINHAVDNFYEPPLTPDYRHFREALQAAIDSFAIDSKRHSERLLKTMAMLRAMHYAHTVSSRNAEYKLREELADNRRARAQSVRYGLFWLFITILSGILWVALKEPGWVIKFFMVGSLYLSWDYFHSLPTLDREINSLGQQINDLLRRRVKSINWKTLIHKLSLLLGYKHITGIEVFRMDHSGDYTNSLPTQH